MSTSPPIGRIPFRYAVTRKWVSDDGDGCTYVEIPLLLLLQLNNIRTGNPVLHAENRRGACMSSSSLPLHSAVLATVYTREESDRPCTIVVTRSADD